MNEKVTATELSTKPGAILDHVLQGAVVEVTRHNRSIATIMRWELLDTLLKAERARGRQEGYQQACAERPDPAVDDSQSYFAYAMGRDR